MYVERGVLLVWEMLVKMMLVLMMFFGNVLLFCWMVNFIVLMCLKYCFERVFFWFGVFCGMFDGVIFKWDCNVLVIGFRMLMCGI